MFVINESTAKKYNLIPSNSSTICCWERANSGLIERSVDEKMIKKKFRFRIFLICFLSVVLRRQRLQSETITNTLEMIRRRDSGWNNIRNKSVCEVV